MKKILLLGVCSLFALNEAHAGKFKEIPFYEEEGQKQTNKFMLQFDDEEGRRDYGFTIEIGKIGAVLKELNISIEENYKKGNKIIGIDFSNTDLINEELGKIVNFLSTKLKNINFLNLSDTHTDATEIDNYTKLIPSLLGYPNAKLNELSEKNVLDMPLAEYYGNVKAKQNYFIEKKDILEENKIDSNIFNFQKIEIKKIGKYSKSEEID